MLLINRLLALLIIAGVSGCSAPGTKFVEAIRSTSEVHLAVRDAAGRFILGTKTTDKHNPNHTPEMLREQYAEVDAKVRKLNEVLVIGLREQWPNALASIGIVTATRRRDTDELRITVLARNMDCNAWACTVFYQLKTEVLDPSGVSIWHAESRYGQSDYDTPIDERLFEDYAAEVTGFMRRAKLVSPAAK